MLFPVTDNPASCETGAVIHFLHAKNMSDEEIHHELCVVVYSLNVTSERTIRQWYTKFKDGKTNVHSEEQSGQPSVCSK
jgi:hypothetical protein